MMTPLLRRLIFFFLAVVFSLQLYAQDSSGIKLQYRADRSSDREMILTIKAVLPPGTKLFSIKPGPAGEEFSSIAFNDNLKDALVNKPLEEGNFTKVKDPVLEMDVSYTTDSVLYMQKFKLAKGDSLPVTGIATLFLNKGEDYSPFEEKIKFMLKDAPTSVEAAPATEKVKAAGPVSNSVTGMSLWSIFLTAFAGGFVALIMPCIYSMIPVTVSFFTKRSKTAAEGRKNAFIYSLSIIIIFTLLGSLISLIFGPAALNKLATNWIANIFFFLVFMVFGISFLGAFDINLPVAWTQGSDTKASTSSVKGIFFMALTLVLVSFSCTGPIIGNLLVLASQGSLYGPMVGMFGFSLALALPFALFAFFPSLLSKWGKSGGWLNAVKVTLGFLEFALALKFLSNADLARGWRLLDREIYLSIWIVLFILLGIYLLGKLKFRHDDELPKNDFGLPYLSVTRLFFAITAFVFAVYMIPGLWGAPLKGISAFLPPMGTQDFILGGGTQTTSHSSTSTTDMPKPIKYYEQMHIFEPEVVKKFGLTTYFDLKEAQEVGRKLKRPVMLDFTGINCVNCRKMEAGVWSDPEVMRRLKENFVIASLFVDVHNVPLPMSEQYHSPQLGEDIETVGELNTDIQVSRFGANAQPYYFFLDDAGEPLRKEGYGYDPDIKKFIALLDEVKAKYDGR